MFTWLNKQGVASDEGFIVQSINRFEIEYRESDKVIRLSVERGLQADGEACIYIYLDELERWSDGTSISKVQQKEILQNFKEAMQFQSINVLVS